MVPDAWSTFLLVVAWPWLMFYAAYKIALVFGPAVNRTEQTLILIAGVGGVIAWWGRVTYSFGVPLDLPFALTMVGVVLMVVPRLVVYLRQHPDVSL